MDSEGYVTITLLATFNRVKGLTTDVNLIREALLPSQQLEVNGFKVRKREGWNLWLLPQPEAKDHSSVTGVIDDQLQAQQRMQTQPQPQLTPSPTVIRTDSKLFTSSQWNSVVPKPKKRDSTPSDSKP